MLMHDRRAQEGADTQDTRIAVSIMGIQGDRLQDLLTAYPGNSLEVQTVTLRSAALR
jgi:hypothetical protein